MKIRDIIGSGINSQKQFIAQLKLKKKLEEYVKKNGVYDLYEKVHNETTPVFVLSTGRSGTSFLTHLLANHSALNVYHEPAPEFFYHSELAYKEQLQNPEKISAIFDVARYELIRNSFVDNKIYIETNNRVTFFANQIASLYPNAKFIHLIRNPFSFVKSGLARNWYSGYNLYDEGKIRLNDESWNAMSQIEKIGWLWNETNLFIEKVKSEIGQDRTITIKSEDLFNSSAHQYSVFDFVGLNRPSDSALKKLTGKKINEGKRIDLDEDQKAKINDYFSINELKLKYGY